MIQHQHRHVLGITVTQRQRATQSGKGGVGKEVEIWVFEWWEAWVADGGRKSRYNEYREKFLTGKFQVSWGQGWVCPCRCTHFALPHGTPYCSKYNGSRNIAKQFFYTFTCQAPRCFMDQNLVLIRFLGLDFSVPCGYF